MTLRLLILCSCLLTCKASPFQSGKCLTGYMTDVQKWVDKNGDLTPNVERDVAMDLSAKLNPDRSVLNNFEHYFVHVKRPVRYLSLAKCRLDRVPKIFHYRGVQGRNLSETVAYLTLFGNSFMDTSSTGEDYQMSFNATKTREVDTTRILGHSRNIWTLGFKDVSFTNLKELDLRACAIETIDEHVFQGMSKLEALYLGENRLKEIDSNAFEQLKNLVHLDISRNMNPPENEPSPLLIKDGAFRKLKNLRSIDMSFTLFNPKTIAAFSRLGPKMQRLSLCWTGINKLNEYFFNNTSIQYLDISGNYEVLNNVRVLRGLENSLQILYATDVKLQNFDVFNNLRRLEILKLTNNEIALIKKDIAMTLRMLKVLDLDKNRFATWLHPIFLGMRSLRVLSMRENNINVVSTEMMNDIKDISYIGISGNLIVCNCNTRDLIETAAKNELRLHNELIEVDQSNTDKRYVSYNLAVTEYNYRIAKRTNVSYLCNREDTCKETAVPKMGGNFLLLDYQTLDGSYSCMKAYESTSIPFIQVQSCNAKSADYDIQNNLERGFNFLLLLVVPAFVLPIILVLFVSRNRIRYFFVAMKNSAALSLISSDEVMSESKIYNYDVFVSYCHEDRAWMLDQLLPHLETDCSVSVCLHERDFQVGLTILENIVSCMDRSRTIMLVISKQFLRSQWCQFEMHLAQHRLLETRREDLTLILLEEIPRRLRPNTLHYLMLTKTYIVWPKKESDQAVFWRRLKKSIVTQKTKLPDNVTLA